MTPKQKFFLVSILVLGIFFRFFRLANVDINTDQPLPQIKIEANMPGGLFPDEAANGLDIISIDQGHFQPFYERGNGREALFFYVIWVVVKIFGYGVWQHHAVSALIGLLVVLGTYLSTKEIFSLKEVRIFWLNKKYFNPTSIALLSSFLIAVNSWHTVLSRTAFRANTIPLFATFTIYFLIKTFREKETRKQITYALLLGATFALGFYTYIAYRIFAPILFVAVGYPLLAYLWKTKKISSIKKIWVKNFALALLSFIIFIFPLAHYFYTHPGSFVGRSGQVSVFNPELNQGNLPATILEVSKESFLAYFTKGDLNFRHNISGLPFLSPLVSPFFAVGLLITIVRGIIYFLRPNKFSENWPFFLLTGWFFGMLVPVVTTAEGIPHGLRSIGTIPTVFVISAVGIFTLYNIIKNLSEYKSKLILKSSKTKSYYKDIPIKVWVFKISSCLLISAFFITLPIETYSNYFVRAYNDPANFYSFRSDLTVVSEYLKEFGNKNSTYLVLDKFSVQTPDYLTVIDPKHLDTNPKNRPYIQVDPEDSYKLKETYNTKPGDQVVFTQSSIFDIKKFKQYNPEFKLILEKRNKFNQAVLAVYQK